MTTKNNDQHDGGGSCCMCDLCQEFRKRYLGIDLLFTAWERVKGDLRATTQSFFSERPKQRREIASVVEEFIEKIEKELIETI